MYNKAIQVNQTTRAFGNFFQICGKEYDEKTAKDFRSWMADKYAAKETLPAPRKAAEDMTMEEYRQYISGCISSLTTDPSNALDSVSVYISDAGFAAMKKDPEYEKWVLDTIQSSFNCSDPWSGVCGGKYMIFRFGASREEAHADIWRAGFGAGKGERNVSGKSEDGFWELRAKRRKYYQEQYEMLEEKRAIAEKIALQHNEIPAVMQAFFQLTWNLPKE